MTQKRKINTIHEKTSQYGHRIPMYVEEEYVADNGAVMIKRRQLSPDEIRELAQQGNVYGDSLEAKPSQHNNYNDTFADYDKIANGIDSIQYEIKHEDEEN